MSLHPSVPSPPGHTQQPLGPPALHSLSQGHVPRKGGQALGTLSQWLSTFLTSLANHKIILLLLDKCNSATVVNCKYPMQDIRYEPPAGDMAHMLRTAVVTQWESQALGLYTQRSYPSGLESRPSGSERERLGTSGDICTAQSRPAPDLCTS